MCAGWSSRVAARACSRRCFGSRRRRPGTSRCSSFWPTRPGSRSCLVRACAERVAPRDRCCRLGRRRHRDRQGRQALAGGEAAVLGHARQDRQLPDHRVACTRSASGGRCRSAGGCTCPRSGATTCARRRKAKIPDEVVFETKSQLAGDLCEQAAGWELPTAPILADSRLRRRRRLPHAACTSSSSSTCVAVRAETSVYGPETSFAVPERNGADRPAAHGRPPRPQTGVGACARRTAAGGAPGRRCPAGRHRRARTSTSRFAFVRVVATNPVRNRHQPPRGSG